MKKIILVLMSLALFSLILCGCGAAESEDTDPTSLIIGTWSNEEAGVVTQFRDDGTYTTAMYGETVLEDTYTTEKADDYNIILTTGEGDVIEICFVDENTLTSEDATMIRVTQNEYIPEEGNTEEGSSEEYVAYPEELVLGTWALDNSVIEFDESGYAYIYEDGEESTYTYELSPIDDSSVTITLIDVDGSTSSETAVFYDSDTMVLGDTTFTRSMG